MSDKERLENINPIGVDNEGNITLKGDDYHWLIEQAEKYEKLLERYLSGVELALIHAKFINQENEIKRLREALAEIASEDEWETVDEARNIARKALEESK